jgi:hypothetical protein
VGEAVRLTLGVTEGVPEAVMLGLTLVVTVGV